MGRIRDWMDSHDIEPSDVPLALAFHEALALSIAGAAWAGCYYAQPSRALLTATGVSAAGPAAAANAAKRQSLARKALTVANNRAVSLISKLQRRVPVLRGGDTQRLTNALAESLVLRAAAKVGVVTRREAAAVLSTIVSPSGVAACKRSRSRLKHFYHCLRSQ